MVNPINTDKVTTIARSPAVKKLVQDESQAAPSVADKAPEDKPRKNSKRRGRLIDERC